MAANTQQATQVTVLPTPDGVAPEEFSSIAIMEALLRDHNRYRDQLMNILVDDREQYHFAFEVEMQHLVDACPQAMSGLLGQPVWMLNVLDNALREYQEKAAVSPWAARVSDTAVVGIALCAVGGDRCPTTTTTWTWTSPVTAPRRASTPTTTTQA